MLGIKKQVLFVLYPWVLLWIVFYSRNVLVSQSCLTLYNPMDCSPPGSSVLGDSPGKNIGVSCHFLLQGISWPRDWLQVSCISRRLLYHFATWEASVSIFGFGHDQVWTFHMDQVNVSMDVLERTKYEQISRTFWYGTDVLQMFQTGLNGPARLITV